MKKLFVFGKNGKMASAIRELAGATDGWTLAETFDAADVAIDFTVAEACDKHLQQALQLVRPLVIGTTGLSEAQMHHIKTASQKIPLLHSPNMSRGIQVMLHLIAAATPMLREDFGIEISEIHHIHKKDRPSGTAKAMGLVVEKITGKKPPIESIREGEVIGEHTIVFGSKFEHLAIFHRALDRKVFADGALKAARWLLDKGPGLYSMKEVLGLVR